MNRTTCVLLSYLFGSMGFSQSYQIERNSVGHLVFSSKTPKASVEGPHGQMTRSEETLSLLPGGLDYFLVRSRDAYLFRCKGNEWTVSKKWLFLPPSEGQVAPNSIDVFFCDQDVLRAISHSGRSIYVFEQGEWKKDSLIPEEIYQRIAHGKIGKAVILPDGSFAILSASKHLFEIYDTSNWKAKKLIPYDDGSKGPFYHYRDPQYCFHENKLWVYFRLVGRLYALDMDRLVEEEITQLPWTVADFNPQKAQSRNAWQGNGVFLPEFPSKAGFVLSSEGSLLLAGHCYQGGKPVPVVAEIREMEKKVQRRPDLEAKYTFGPWLSYSSSKETFQDGKAILKAIEKQVTSQP